MAVPKMKPIHQLAYQYTWNLYELAEMLGSSYTFLHGNLVNSDLEPTKVEDIEPDGRAWIRFEGVLIPARKNVNSRMSVLRRDVDRLLGNNPSLHPAGADL